MLPPTLEPHPVASAAPRSSKFFSGSLSLLAYGLMGSLIWFVPHSRPLTVQPDAHPSQLSPPKPWMLMDLEPSVQDPHQEEGPSGGRGHSAEPQASLGLPAQGLAPSMSPLALGTLPKALEISEDATKNPTMDLPAIPLGHPGGTNTAAAGLGMPGQGSGKGAGAGGNGSSSPHRLALGAGVDPRLQVVKSFTPKYDKAFGDKDLIGVVWLRVTVDAEGMPISAVPLNGNPLLHQECIRTAMKWRWDSPLKHGHEAPYSFRLGFDFKQDMTSNAPAKSW